MPGNPHGRESIDRICRLPVKKSFKSFIRQNKRIKSAGNFSSLFPEDNLQSTVVMALRFPAKKILLVDDDPVILKALSWNLEHQGYEALTALDGPEAFNCVRRHKPDLIVLDIFFPPDAFQSGNTWDAFLIIQWLQRMGASGNRHVPIIVMSGAEPGEFKDRCLAAGAVA
ncbi:MAG TPA: response regulator, partial [Verrucomicrobiae bacterium]|nr:response regulator [Verrucomicrobiae bacterium]